MVIPDVALPDLQNSVDTRGVALDKVGIRNYKIPFDVMVRDGGIQHTVGLVDIYASLNPEVKGANMSRYSQVVEKALQKGCISMFAVKDMLAACKERLGAEESFVRVDFPYFVRKYAPVSGVESWSSYRSVLEGRDTKRDGLRLFVSTHVEYMSLCPCSKEMSLVQHDEKGGYGRGAHNQRSTGRITVSLRDVELTDPSRQFIWLEDLIDLVERHASCPIWNTLKRPDEQYVTEQSYKNPKFVEDVARDVSLEISGWSAVNGFIFITEHHESIHQYDAVCVVRGGQIYIP